MGWCEWCFGSFDQAIVTLTKAADLCEAVGRTEDAGQAYLLWQWGHLYQGDDAPALAVKEQVLRMMEQRFNCRWYMWAVAGAAGSRQRRKAKGGRIGEEFADDSAISFATHVLSMVYTSKGDLARALACAELAVQKAPTSADKEWAQAALAWAWCRNGEPCKGIAILAQVVPLQRAVRQVYGEIFALFLGEGYWLAGEYDKATQTLQEHLQIATRNGMKFHIGSAHRLLGEVAMHTDLV